jgi:hypothetical protein
VSFTSDAKVATVLGSIPAYPPTYGSEISSAVDELDESECKFQQKKIRKEKT